MALAALSDISISFIGCILQLSVFMTFLSGFFIMDILECNEVSARKWSFTERVGHKCGRIQLFFSKHNVVIALVILHNPLYMYPTFVKIYLLTFFR